MIKKNVLIIIFFLIYASFLSATAQTGNLLLIGGGTEYSGSESWNGEAFQWAVDKSTNKKVALISYNASSDSDWMPDHFVSDWGAVSAKNFVIDSRTEADEQATYDSLMNYDVLYIKGGDQFNYYSTYKNTKTEDAIRDKYEEGEVICGTSAGLAILAEVDFTAENGTVYPEECLLDWDNNYVTLANDFLNLFPGYIFDSHFTERGRFGRLLGFLAYWSFTENEKITGLGIDDMTAMAVDENNIGRVFGTGCANVYQIPDNQSFVQKQKSFTVDSIHVKQLLQGCTVDFNTGEISGFEEFVEPLKNEETGNFTVLASGSDILTDNDLLLENFINEYGESSDSVLILTGSSHTDAINFKNTIIDYGADDAIIYSVDSQNAHNENLIEKINTYSKFLFINIDDNNFCEFIEGDAGQILNSRIKKNGMTSAFIGDESRWAGNTVVVNYLESTASYYGNLEFHKGLNLLGETVIIPKTFSDNDIYENTSSAVPYTMVKDSLTYGIWLSAENHFEYSPDEDGTYLTSYGNIPVIILKSLGANAGFSEQTSRGTGEQNPRMIAGFDKMTMSLIGTDEKYKMGDNVDDNPPTTIDFPAESTARTIDPIYLRDGDVKFELNAEDSLMEIYDLTGVKVMSKQIQSSETRIYTASLDSGVYLVKISNQHGIYTKAGKFVVK